MATKLQEISRKENWILYTLKGMDSTAAWLLSNIKRDLTITTKRNERLEISELEHNLRTLRSIIYFLTCNIKNLQEYRRKEREKK